MTTTNGSVGNERCRDQGSPRNRGRGSHRERGHDVRLMFGGGATISVPISSGVVHRLVRISYIRDSWRLTGRVTIRGGIPI